MPSMKNTPDQIVKNIPKEDKENPTIGFLLEQFEIILTLQGAESNSQRWNCPSQEPEPQTQNKAQQIGKRSKTEIFRQRI